MIERLDSRGHIPFPEEELLNGEVFAIDDKQVVVKKSRYLGSIFTPPDFAQFLTSWAIRNPQDKILDIGIGEGVFIFAAYRRLLDLGAKDSDARQQLYGAEIDTLTYNKFSRLTDYNGTSFLDRPIR